MKKKMSITAAIKKATAEIIDQGHGEYSYLDDKGNSWGGHFAAGTDQRTVIRNERAKRAITNIFGDGWEIDPALYDALCQPGSLRDVVKDAVDGIQARFIKQYNDASMPVIKLLEAGQWERYDEYNLRDIFGKHNGCDECFPDAEIEEVFDYVWRTGDATTLDDVRAILRNSRVK